MRPLRLVAPVVVGVAYAAANSLVPVEHRRELNAVVVGGAGAAYLSGGLGPVELPFTTAMTWAAFRGLRSWRWIGLAWLLHSAWDAVHHHAGRPILPFVGDSSLGCAICDPVIALWCFAGGPSIGDLRRRVLP